MSWSWTLYRYLAKQFLIGIAVVYGTLLMLAFSIDVVDLHQPHRQPQCEHAGGDRHGAAAASRPRPEDDALRGPARRGVFLRAAVAQPGTGRGARRRHVGLGLLLPPLAVAAGLGFVVVLIVTPISARMLAQFAALEANTSRARRRSFPSRRTASICARATPASNRSSTHCASPTRASIWRTSWCSCTALPTVSSAGSTRSPPSSRAACGR